MDSLPTWDTFSPLAQDASRPLLAYLGYSMVNPFSGAPLERKCWLWRVSGEIELRDGKRQAIRYEVVGHEQPEPDEAEKADAHWLRFTFAEDPQRNCWVWLLSERFWVRPPLSLERQYPWNGDPIEKLVGIEHVRTLKELDELTHDTLRAWATARPMLRALSQAGRPTLEQETDGFARELAAKAWRLKRDNPRLSLTIIAEHHCGVSRSTLHRYMKRFPK